MAEAEACKSKDMSSLVNTLVSNDIFVCNLWLKCENDK